jgi:hypothetical protein
MNAVKSRLPESPPHEAGPLISGKLVILVVLAVAITGAAASWFFRYNATHRTVEFWGAETTKLIRDAPHVALLKLLPLKIGDTADTTLVIDAEKYTVGPRLDVSSAHGMTHLRNALLEDRSFEFDAQLEAPPPHYWRWALEFRDGGKSATILFGDDCMSLRLQSGNGGVVSCRPIAAGLQEMFAEFSSNTANSSR